MKCPAQHVAWGPTPVKKRPFGLGIETPIQSALNNRALADGPIMIIIPNTITHKASFVSSNKNGSICLYKTNVYHIYNDTSQINACRATRNSNRHHLRHTHNEDIAMPASTPNRLINEKSPYLQQQAFNPVDWHL